MYIVYLSRLHDNYDMIYQSNVIIKIYDITTSLYNTLSSVCEIKLLIYVCVRYVLCFMNDCLGSNSSARLAYFDIHRPSDTYNKFITRRYILFRLVSYVEIDNVTNLFHTQFL